MSTENITYKGVYETGQQTVSNPVEEVVMCDSNEKLEPYFDGELWILPYLDKGAGGFGGGVGEIKSNSRNEVIKIYNERYA